jgi:hypothetical protein
MDVPATRFESSHDVTITRAGVDVSQLFTFTAVTKRVPQALWGESVTPRTTGDALIGDTLAGFVITPTAPVQPAQDAPQSTTAADAQYSMVQIADAFGWQDERVFVPAAEQGRPVVGRALGASAARAALLAELGIGEKITVNSSTADAFLVAPQVGTLIGDAL